MHQTIWRNLTYLPNDAIPFGTPSIWGLWTWAKAQMSRGCTRNRATTRLKRPSALKQVLQLQDADTEIPLWHWPGQHKRHGFPVLYLRYWCGNDQFEVGFGSSWRMWGQFVLKHFEQLDIVNCKVGPTYCILWGGENLKRDILYIVRGWKGTRQAGVRLTSHSHISAKHHTSASSRGGQVIRAGTQYARKISFLARHDA